MPCLGNETPDARAQEDVALIIGMSRAASLAGLAHVGLMPAAMAAAISRPASGWLSRFGWTLLVAGVARLGCSVPTLKPISAVAREQSCGIPQWAGP
jgi:hypothetical protein